MNFALVKDLLCSSKGLGKPNWSIHVGTLSLISITQMQLKSSVASSFSAQNKLASTACCSIGHYFLLGPCQRWQEPISTIRLSIISNLSVRYSSKYTEIFNYIDYNLWEDLLAMGV